MKVGNIMKENLLQKQSTELLREIEALQDFVDDYLDETKANSLGRTSAFEIEKRLEQINSIAYSIEKISLTHEERFDHQVERILSEINRDQKEISNILKEDKEVEDIKDVILEQITNTKYKNTHYTANKNDLRAWILQMIKAYPILVDNNILIYDNQYRLSLNYPIK